jgi:hypothetical protein
MGESSQLVRQIACWAMLIASVGGCARMRQPPPNALTVQNPMFVPNVDKDVLWDHVVDAVDNYFEVEREERVKQVGDYLTVGRLDTVPSSSATFLEPWRRDSVTPYDRLESTLQSMRRRATIQVTPADGGYLVDVAVYKELEDVPRPEYSPTSTASLQYPTSVERFERPVNAQIAPLGWIPQGRDCALEGRILEAVATLAGPQPVRTGGFGFFGNP